MPQVRLGKTGIVVEKNAFGALPIQRIPVKDAAYLLRKAYDNGVRYFDTARAYSDSELKLGEGLAEVRHDLFIATKTQAKTGEAFRRDLETSLRTLKTDYIDVFQFHNPAFMPAPGGEDGLYDAMLEAKAAGKVRFIGITNHRHHVAKQAIESGLYDTLQFPFSYLATEIDVELTKLAAAADMGFIAMKGLAGGLINRSEVAYAFMSQYENVLPIWGVQKESELDEFLSYIHNPPAMTPEIAAFIEEERKQLCGSFCRGCGYCLPCPAGINIPLNARMSLMLRRAPSAAYLTPQCVENMMRIESCLHCNHCKDNCPYGLDTPTLLRENLEDYKTFLK